MLEWTGERFLPWIEGAQIHYEHLHRYAFASQFVKGKKVLDLGCGEGYGTYMLAREAEYVAGVEIDKATVQHAKSRYIKHNLEFIEGSMLAVSIEGKKKFDVAVCFEGIEHIAEHDKLLSEAKRLLKDNGLFIVSTPNKTVYTDAPDYHNPFHVKELYFEEFSNLLRRYFKHLRIFGQRVYAGSNMWSIHQRKSRGYEEAVVKKGDMEFYFAERTSKEPVYFIALASNASLKPSISVTDSWLTDASNTLLNDYEGQLAKVNHAIANLEANLQEKVAQISSLETNLQEKDVQIYGLESQIYQIQRSIPMQLVNRYQRIVERLLRPGTRRRRYYELGLSGIRIILNEGWRTLWWRFKNYRRTKKGKPLSAKAEKTKTVKVVKPKQERLITLRPTCNRFALYVSSLGNYFFAELAALLSAGLKELGFQVDWRDENAGFADDADWHIVAAPHELFYLGAGKLLQDKELPSNLIIINFEQPSTSWFALAQKCFSKAHAIWDINYEVAQFIADSGFACEHLPFGYVPEFFKEVPELPKHYGTCFLEDRIRNGKYLHEPLRNRPLDVLFIGSLTQRREEFFALAAPVLANYSCYLHVSDPSFPLIPGQNTPMNTATVAGLGQRAKIILNIHQGKDKYFEWQRIVTHGIWQKALVISEPCSPGPPFQPGIDFVEAPLEEIPAKIQYYLSSAQGQEEAQAIATQGFQTLTEKCRLADSLRSLILHLYIPAQQTKFWELLVSGQSVAEKNITEV